MQPHWTRKLLTALMVVVTLAAIVHAASEIDPCLLSGKEHSSEHAEHFCPICDSAWIGGPAAPNAIPSQDVGLIVPATVVFSVSLNHVYVRSSRGPPSSFNF